ncbi:hypothetical protein GPJ56_007227 [Histomonas meleagridis]|nr:hypothetical protein GPJ56_007227 [Histomonas meleagridis]
MGRQETSGGGGLRWWWRLRCGGDPGAWRLQRTQAGDPGRRPRQVSVCAGTSGRNHSEVAAGDPGGAGDSGETRCVATRQVRPGGGDVWHETQAGGEPGGGSEAISVAPRQVEDPRQVRTEAGTWQRRRQWRTRAGDSGVAGDLVCGTQAGVETQCVALRCTCGAEAAGRAARRQWWMRQVVETGSGEHPGGARHSGGGGALRRVATQVVSGSRRGGGRQWWSGTSRWCAGAGAWHPGVAPRQAGYEQASETQAVH